MTQILETVKRIRRDVDVKAVISIKWIAYYYVYLNNITNLNHEFQDGKKKKEIRLVLGYVAQSPSLQVTKTEFPKMSAVVRHTRDLHEFKE